MKNERTTNLADVVEFFYGEFLALYGDPELASVATAAMVNDLMAAQVEKTQSHEKTRATAA